MIFIKTTIVLVKITIFYLIIEIFNENHLITVMLVKKRRLMSKTIYGYPPLKAGGEFFCRGGGFYGITPPHEKVKFFLR